METGFHISPLPSTPGNLELWKSECPTKSQTSKLQNENPACPIGPTKGGKQQGLPFSHEWKTPIQKLKLRMRGLFTRGFRSGQHVWHNFFLFLRAAFPLICVGYRLLFLYFQREANAAGGQPLRSQLDPFPNATEGPIRCEDLLMRLDLMHTDQSRWIAARASR